MSDLPTQGLYQQMHARPVSPEHLEVLGKQASSKFVHGEEPTLTQAVIGVVKYAGLSPEQVKRVVEYANTEAYLHEFKKEATDHRYIDFGSGGPANPAEVLRSLNDGSGSTVFDRGTRDYEYPPEEKVSAAGAEAALEQLLRRDDVPIRQANPFREVVDFQQKLAGANQHLGTELDVLEIQYADDANRVYQGVKQAALTGIPLGHVLQAWATVAPSAEYVKVAFQLLTPRLVRDRVFSSPADVSGSLEKTAGSAALVNLEHPLVTDFGVFCETLQKLAEYRMAKEIIREQLSGIQDFLKEAAGGAIPKAVGAALKGARVAGKAVNPLAEALVEGAGGPAEWAVAHVPHLAGLVAANELRLKADQSPLYHRALSHVPGTQEYNYRTGRNF